MKHLHSIVLILLFPLLSFGQNDYYVADNNLYATSVIDGGDLTNSRICQVKSGSETIEYSPYEVSEYGLKNGRVYISKDIQIADSSKRVFLERLHNDETTLYYYSGTGINTFFIEKDSTLFVELPRRDAAKQNYSEFLLNFTDDCPNVSDACKLASYKKNSLSRLLESYDKCELKYFPRVKYGLLFGREFSRLVPSYKENKYSDMIINQDRIELEYFEYNYNNDFSIGIFIDHPIHAGDFSVRAELLYSKHKYSYNQTSETEILDLIINLSTIRVPLLIKYTLPTNNLRPYFNAGPIFSYNWKNESFLHSLLTEGNGRKIKTPIKGSIVPNSEIGYVVGAGLEVDIDFKRSLFFDVRYGNQLGISKKISSTSTLINMSLGINF